MSDDYDVLSDMFDSDYDIEQIVHIDTDYGMNIDNNTAHAIVEEAMLAYKYLVKIIESHNTLQDIFHGMALEAYRLLGVEEIVPVMHISICDISTVSFEAFCRDTSEIKDRMFHTMNLINRTYNGINVIYLSKYGEFTDSQLERMETINRYWNMFKDCKLALVNFTDV